MYLDHSMVEILPSRCVSCGQCVKACPRSLLQLIPRRARVMSHCATREKLKSVSEVCDAGCINCLRCLKACPADAIAYEKGRIEIRHADCLEFGSSCGEACVRACARGILRRRHAVPLQPESPLVDQSEADSAAERLDGAEADSAPEAALPQFASDKTRREVTE
jgi:electron transport complex protein RnfB